MLVDDCDDDHDIHDDDGIHMHLCDVCTLIEGLTACTAEPEKQGVLCFVVRKNPRNIVSNPIVHPQSREPHAIRLHHQRFEPQCVFVCVLEFVVPPRPIGDGSDRRINHRHRQKCSTTLPTNMQYVVKSNGEQRTATRLTHRRLPATSSPQRYRQQTTTSAQFGFSKNLATDQC